MSDYTYIKLTKHDGTPVIPITAARQLTISLPFLGNKYQDTQLHLQIRWSLDNVSDPLSAAILLDTGLSDAHATKVMLYDGSAWINIPDRGFYQAQANCRVLVDLVNTDPDAFLFYSWYYIADGITVHVTPWASTKLTATAGIPKHSELQDRNDADQHSIESITGLSEALSKDYQEVKVYTDAEMSEVVVANGKLITFVGYSNGTNDGCIVMRYKTADGTFGNLTPGITATLDGDNLIIEDSITEGTTDTTINVIDNVLELVGPSIEVSSYSLNLNNESTVDDENSLTTS